MARITRQRARIAIGFASGRQGLINSLTATPEEVAKTKADERAKDSSQISAFNRGDITMDQLETYINGRLGSETDSSYKTQLSDALSNARVSQQRTTDTKKVQQFRDGSLPFADLLTYLQGRAAKPMNATDGESLTSLISSVTVEHNNKQDATWLTRWKAGEATNADFKAYLNGRLAMARTDEDRANLRAAVTGVEQKGRRDQDNKMANDYAAGKLGAGSEGLKAYTKYLVDQAKAPGVTPEESSAYDSLRQKTEETYNVNADNKVYFEYLSGVRSADNVTNYFNSRLTTAPQAQLDTIQQRIAQVKDREDAIVKSNAAALKAGASASRTAQNQYDSYVKGVVSDAAAARDRIIKDSTTESDLNRRAELINYAWEGYKKALSWASGQSVSDAGNYTGQLVPGPTGISQADAGKKLDVQTHIGGEIQKRTEKQVNDALQVGGSDPRNSAAAIANSVEYVLRALENRNLLPDARAALEAQLAHLKEVADARAGETAVTAGRASQDIRDQAQAYFNIAKSSGSWPAQLDRAGQLVYPKTVEGYLALMRADPRKAHEMYASGQAAQGSSAQTPAYDTWLADFKKLSRNAEDATAGNSALKNAVNAGFDSFGGVNKGTQSLESRNPLLTRQQGEALKPGGPPTTLDGMPGIPAVLPLHTPLPPPDPSFTGNKPATISPDNPNARLNQGIDFSGLFGGIRQVFDGLTGHVTPSTGNAGIDLSQFTSGGLKGASALPDGWAPPTPPPTGEVYLPEGPAPAWGGGDWVDPYTTPAARPDLPSWFPKLSDMFGDATANAAVRDIAEQNLAGVDGPMNGAQAWRQRKLEQAGG